MSARRRILPEWSLAPTAPLLVMQQRCGRDWFRRRGAAHELWWTLAAWTAPLRLKQSRQRRGRSPRGPVEPAISSSGRDAEPVGMLSHRDAPTVGPTLTMLVHRGSRSALVGLPFTMGDCRGVGPRLGLRTRGSRPAFGGTEAIRLRDGLCVLVARAVLRRRIVEERKDSVAVASSGTANPNRPLDRTRRRRGLQRSDLQPTEQT
jgi:hypothetical protein